MKDEFHPYYKTKNPILAQWGETTTFGIFYGLCFTEKGLFGYVDKNGDICKFKNIKKARIKYKHILDKML